MLLQSSFNVWVENKKDRIKDLRFKAHQRYIFLYEGLVLFTKKYGREESPSYAFKNALKVRFLFIFYLYKNIVIFYVMFYLLCTKAAFSCNNLNVVF